MTDPAPEAPALHEPTAADRIATAVALGPMATEEDRAAAVALVSPDDVTSLVHGLDGDLGATDRSSPPPILATGLGLSPGVGSGLVCRSAEEALDAWDAGDDVVLFVVETRPADEPAMRIASAIVTERGGAASHAAIVARDLGVPAVCGVGAVDLAPGRHVRVDGSAGTVHDVDQSPESGAARPGGQARAGDGESVVEPALPPALVTLLGWCDDIARGRLTVMANADRAESARRAVAFGAQGIGLCRIEHVFLGSAAGLVGEVLAGGDAPLGELESLLADELTGVLGAMDGRPVTIRLLDAPAHEFGGPVEHDPMLGLRGVRLGLIRPELVDAQVRAVATAARRRREAGGDPRPRLLVPMVADRRELSLTVDAIRAVLDPADDIEVGVMIETPRAALVAGELARDATFASFGSNDLTQLTWGWSRDDLDARLVPSYQSFGIMERSPFTALDVEGVGRLIATAVAAARRTRPGMPMSLCGEHGGDPPSIVAALVLGVDTVSCSPFRVPVARLAAAQAVLATGTAPTGTAPTGTAG